MAQKLKESILSKVEPKDTNVVWYQPTEGGIKEKIYNGGWKDINKSDIKIGKNTVIGENVTIQSGIGINWDSGGFIELKGRDRLPARIGSNTEIGGDVRLDRGLIISTSTNPNSTGIEIKFPHFGESVILPFGFNGNEAGGATKVTWNANSNMNDFKKAGVYDIYGERTVNTDNLPISNTGGGNSIAARLTVVASTLQPANNEICITQFLQLSNRIGGEGTAYVRTYNENNNGKNGWSPWQKQMGVVETLVNSDDTTVNQTIFSATAEKIGDGLNGMIDNGMYSGIYIDNLTYAGTGMQYYLSAQPTFIETFVLIVINDYAATGKLNVPRHITQLKYAVDAITGQSTIKKRVGTGDNDITWSIWADVEGDTNHSIYETLNSLVQNVDTKAPKVGYAPDLKVGAADELASKDIAESHQISIIRPTGNASINNGNATIEKIKGKSIVWNQQIKNPDFSNGLENWSAGSGAIIEVNSDGSVKVTNKEEQYNKDIRQRAVSKGHVYLFCIKLKSSFNGEVGVYLGGGNSVAKYNVVKDETLVYRDIKVADHFDTLFRPVSILNASSGSSVDIYHAYLYDLTQMFGEGNEPNTIEEFDAMKPYGVTNDYNAGEVVSYVGANTLKSVGVNIWDEQWEVGGLSNGEPTNNSTQIRSKNFIPCIGGMEYYGYMGWSSKDYLHVAIFDENKVWQYNIGVNRKTFTIPDNAAYIKIFTKHECGYGNAYKGDICISLSQSGKQENRYVSYEEDSIKLLNPLVINDSTGNPLFPNGLLSAGDVYDEITTTEAIKRIAIVNLGDLAWNKDETIGPRWDAFLPETIKAVQGWNKIGWLNTTKYNVGTVGFDGVENKIGVYGKTVYVQDNSYASKESFKESMQGVYLYYELSEPIVVNISENIDVQYKVWNCGTEGFIAEGKTTPLNADLIYPFNAVGRILDNNAQISTLQETDNEIINSVEYLKASVDTKAPKVGYAPDLKVDFAKELVGRGVAEPQEIGTIRPTGVISIGDGNATIEKVKGNSVVWNQWCDYNKSAVPAYGLTIEKTDDGLRIYGTSTTTGNMQFRLTRDTRIRDNSKKFLVYDALHSPYKIALNNADYSVSIIMELVEGKSYDIIISPKIHDLTQMFGADNEPTTIEEFEARKPLGVSNDYNEGEIISYDGANDLKSVGFNAFNGTYAKVIGGWKYHALGTITSLGFTAELDGETTEVTLDGEGMFTPTEDGYVYAEGSDIIIHLTHTYTPEHTNKYEEDTLQLPNIKAIKDKDGNQLFPYGLLSAGNVHDEITATKAIKRIGVIDIGTLKWFLVSNIKTFYTEEILNAKKQKGYSKFQNILLRLYNKVGAYDYGTTFTKKDDKTYCLDAFVGNVLNIRDSSYTDATTFKQAMQGVLLYYELAEPIEVDLPEPLNLTYDAWDFGTEELVAEGKTTPLNADVVYQFNAVDRIRENTAKNQALEAELAELKAQLTQLTQATNNEVSNA